MTVRVAALMLLGFVVTACASVDNTDYWWKPGMTKDEFARDADFCHQTTTVRSPGAMVGACRAQDFQSWA